MARWRIIKNVNAPIGFFVLALLIIEGFLTVPPIFSKELSNPDFYFKIVIIGVILFLVVVFLVWLLVWCRPQNLTLAGKNHVELEKAKIRERTVQDKIGSSGAKNEKINKEVEKYIEYFYDTFKNHS